MTTSFGRIQFSQKGKRITSLLPAKPKPKLSNGPDEAELVRQRQYQFEAPPKISVVVPVYNTPIIYLTEMIRSVMVQTYQNWELCLAEGASDNPEVQNTLAAYAAGDERVKIVLLPENRGVAGNTNQGLALASGEFVVFLDHDDILAPSALFEVALAIVEHPGTSFIYSDYAVTDQHGKVLYPFFCPDFSKYFYLSFPYIVHLVAIRKMVLEEVGLMDEVMFNGGVSHDVDLFLRVFSRISEDKVIHISQILYYWRSHPSSAGQRFKDQVHHYTKLAINRYLSSADIDGWAEDGPLFNSFRIRLRTRRDPVVSVIIITHNDWEPLQKSLSALFSGNYSNIEVIVVSNGTDNRDALAFHASLSPECLVLKHDLSSNYSAIYNYAVRYAKGDVLVFLHEGVAFASNDALSSLIELCHLPEVGVVGAKLLYPDNRLQHAGIVLGLFGSAGHLHKYTDAYVDTENLIPNRGYLSSLVSIREYSAVSGACLATKTKTFLEVNGFDEDFKSSYNDVDLCLRILEAGYKVLFTPYALSYYHESELTSEGTDRNTLYQAEDASLFLKKWGGYIEKGDPYFNRNLELNSHIPVPMTQLASSRGGDGWNE